MDMMKCGIYALVFNTDNGEKVYIGSTAESFKQRLRRHLGLLRRGKHNNPHMQSLYFKYGAPEFRILEIIDDHDIVISREQYWIERIGLSKLINVGPAIPSPRYGTRHTPEAIAKISEAGKRGKGRKMSQEARDSISRGMKGKKPTPEVEKKRIAAVTGKKLSTEHKAEISAGIRNPEVLSRIIAASTGRIVSQETREKMSKAHKGRIISEECRKKHSIAQTGKKLSPETKDKISKVHKGKLLSEEHRKKISETLTETLKRRSQNGRSD